MQRVNINKPFGIRFVREFGRWLNENGFRDIPGSIRSRLKEIMAERESIERWRISLPLEVRMRINHPNEVISRWREVSGKRQSARIDVGEPIPRNEERKK